LVLKPDDSSTNSEGAGGSVSFVRLLVAFLKIGSIGFGGGMAVIALMEQEFVRKRRLISLDEFVHSVGLGQVLGSFAVNVAIFIGYRLFGVAGALLSAGAFLAPSITLVIILSDLYFRYHAVSALQSTVAGLAPVVIALILDAGWSIGRKVLRSWPAMLIAAGALAAGVAQWNAVWVLVTAGAAGFLLPVRPTPPRQPSQPEKAAGSGAVNLMPFAFFALATVALFAPGIVLMLAISHQYGRFRDDRRAQRFLAGVNPAVAGLILSATLVLGRTALISWNGFALLALSFSLLAWLRWHPASVLAIGAAAGYFGLLP
jgi:chromate transport protein ChrA